MDENNISEIYQYIDDYKNISGFIDENQSSMYMQLSLVALLLTYGGIYSIFEVFFSNIELFQPILFILLIISIPILIIFLKRKLKQRKMEILNQQKTIESKIKKIINEKEKEEYGIVRNLENSKEDYEDYLELIDYKSLRMISYKNNEEDVVSYCVVQDLINLYRKIKNNENLNIEEIEKYYNINRNILFNLKYRKNKSVDEYEELIKPLKEKYSENKSKLKNKFSKLLNNVKPAKEKEKKYIIVKEL
jgi:hypothetical protein